MLLAKAKALAAVKKKERLANLASSPRSTTKLVRPPEPVEEYSEEEMEEEEEEGEEEADDDGRMRRKKEDRDGERERERERVSE